LIWLAKMAEEHEYREQEVLSYSFDKKKQSLKTSAPSIKTLIDKVDSNTTYVGEAVIGTATSKAKWRIKKLTTSGTVTQILYADGNDNFDNIWDNRTSLDYS